MMIDFNGEFISAKQPVLFAENRGYNYADGLFETLRFIDKKIIFWEDHYERLISGMQTLQMEIPSYFSKDYLANRIVKLIAKNKLSNQAVRIKINVHREAKGFYTPTAQNIAYFIRVEELKKTTYSFSLKKYKAGIYNLHKVAADPLSTLKTTNKLINVLGSIYAQKNGFDNCFLYNQKGNIIEALNGNLFCVFENQIKTPPLSEGCLNGITRKKIMLCIKENNFRLSEEPLQLSDLLEAKELWITNSIMGIQPVFQFKDKIYKAEIAKQLEKALNLKAKMN